MGFTIIDVPERSRFEARDGDTVAGYIDYIGDKGVTVLVHTHVEQKGAGVGSTLARGVLDLMLESGKPFEVTCPFVQRWVRSHPDYQERVVLPE